MIRSAREGGDRLGSEVAEGGGAPTVTVSQPSSSANTSHPVKCWTGDAGTPGDGRAWEIVDRGPVYIQLAARWRRAEWLPVLC